MKEYKRTFISRILNLFTILGTVGFLAAGIWLYTTITGVDFNSHIPAAATIVIVIISAILTTTINILLPRTSIRVSDNAVSFVKRGEAFLVLLFEEYTFEPKVVKSTINFIIPFTNQYLCTTSKTTAKVKDYSCDFLTKSRFNRLISDINSRTR
jgi:hypothetical protein